MTEYESNSPGWRLSLRGSIGGMKRLLACGSEAGAVRPLRTLWAGVLVACRTLLCIGLLTGLAACEGGMLEEEPASEAIRGSFEAQVGGALEGRLEGTATARLDTSGYLAGLELDDAVDTTRAGLSFELTPRSPTAPRTYVVRPRRAAPGDTARIALMNAYLRLHGYEFAALAGSLRVHRDTSGLHGVFDLRLQGMVDAASDEPAVVSVRGRLDDLRPRRTGTP